MKTKSKAMLITIGFCGLLSAQSGGSYLIKKYSINNGGGVLSGGSYQLTSSIAQVDASNRMSNGAYSLSAGMWHQYTDSVFANGFE